MLPDEWAADNRVYPKSAGVPGKRDPFLTPYMVPFARAVSSGLHSKIVFVCGSQMGKTDSFLDVIGERMATSPAPILYVGPTEKFVREQFEPRVIGLVEQSKVLSEKIGRGKRSTKTRKVFGGVPLRLGHGRSSSAVKSDPFAIALTDEVDELLTNVRNQGDPIGLIDLRGETYPDFVHALTSTPSRGMLEVTRDEESGLDFWGHQNPDDLDSKIWGLWQQGTRYHWAWPCPACGEFFIPRFACLEVDGKDWKDVKPREALTKARMICPRNGCVLGHDDPLKTLSIAERMNAKGVYVAPGQSIDKRGRITGDPPDADIISFWVSGLCSPFTSWNERAKAYVEAVQSGDLSTVQTVTNGGFGELHAPDSGDLPEWKNVLSLALPYPPNEVPAGVRLLTMGVDVQKNRLVYVVRGWGLRQESWLIKHGELWGDTAELGVWSDLAEIINGKFGRHRITLAFIDAGFRPGKKDEVPVHRVYEFARRFPGNVRASKGFAKRAVPVDQSSIDVQPSGKKVKHSLKLARLSTDDLKVWIHDRLRWPKETPGGFHLHEKVDERYCRQLVSEARVRGVGGVYTWVQRSRENHFLDAEAMAYGAAWLANVQKLDLAPPAPRARVISRPAERDEPQPTPARLPPPPPAAPAPVAAAKPKPAAPQARKVHLSSYL